jgi:hypothetical protein
MRWEMNVARTGERRGAYIVVVGRPERKWPLRKPRHKWECSIKMDVQEIRWGPELVSCGSK